MKTKIEITDEEKGIQMVIELEKRLGYGAGAGQWMICGEELAMKLNEIRDRLDQIKEGMK